MSFPNTLLVTAPASEPISRTEAKLHCRVDHSAEDDLLDWLITAARQHVENYTGRALIEQTWKAYFEEWEDEFHLPYAPLISVTHVKYTDVTNTTTTVSAADYFVNAIEQPGEVKLAYGKAWPSATLQVANPIEIQFIAGYGTAGSSIPMPIRQAMYLLIEHWYRNRAGVTVGNTAAAISAPLQIGIDSLLANYRVYC